MLRPLCSTIIPEMFGFDLKQDDTLPSSSLMYVECPNSLADFFDSPSKMVQISLMLV